MTPMNSIARFYAQILGAMLMVLGVFGWIPALSPDGLFLGLFALNPVHNLVHLLSGLVGLSAGLLLPDRSVRLYTITMGVVYGLVAFVGYLQVSTLGVLALNMPDTVLHTAIFVLSLLVVLAAFSEQEYLVHHAQLAASLLPRARQEQAGALRFAATPLPAEPPQASGMPNTMAVLHEHLRRLERNVSKIDPLLERQLALEQDVGRLRRDVEELRAYLQALAPKQMPGQPPSRPPATGRPSSRPSGGGAADPGAWPHE
jgi:hypothetical protein